MPKPSQSSNGKPVNKSAAVRDMVAQYPNASCKEIVSLLGGKSVKAQPSLVYYIKSRQSQEKRRQKRERVSETSQSTGSSNPVALILKVKSLAQDAGGIHNLKQLVDLLAE